MAELAETSSDGVTGSSFRLVRFESEIFPFLQSTQWIPRTSTHERDRLGGAYDVVFPAGRLAEVRRAARDFPAGDSMGLMLGRGCECPWTRRHWLRVTSIVSEEPPAGRRFFRREVPEPDERPLEARLFELMQRADEVCEQGEHVLGWYRTRNSQSVGLTAEESHAHAEHFHEPWHFSVILPTREEDEVMGVFGRDNDGRIRQRLLRPFYELQPRRGDRVARARPVNYRIVERAEDLPGASPAWNELKRRRAPVLATIACTVVGVAAGLALSFELSRANQPGGLLAGEAAEFASPLDQFERATPTPEERAATRVGQFDRRVEEYWSVQERPPAAESYCRDLGAAYDGVHGAFVNLIRERDEIEADDVLERIRVAMQEKGRVDTSFDASTCRR